MILGSRDPKMMFIQTLALSLMTRPLREIFERKVVDHILTLTPHSGDMRALIFEHFSLG